VGRAVTLDDLRRSESGRNLAERSEQRLARAEQHRQQVDPDLAEQPSIERLARDLARADGDALSPATAMASCTERGTPPSVMNVNGASGWACTHSAGRL